MKIKIHWLLQCLRCKEFLYFRSGSPSLHDRGAVRIVEHFLKKLKPFRRVFDIEQFYILNLGSYFKQQQYQIFTLHKSKLAKIIWQTLRSKGSNNVVSSDHMQPFGQVVNIVLKIWQCHQTMLKFTEVCGQI
jgi:hypothetical protein